ncbi:hypothetical protein EVAR_12839_1 [Eumeta japonica]|uniref:Uncharacterized protein n=1 Tax=Eumeta variegata TaxID=151549 RepID=A0A4C1UC77_EUMVA|nr:hypothetical protein EVAR_12839_1 [Eumeta japonica]
MKVHLCALNVRILTRRSGESPRAETFEGRALRKLDIYGPPTPGNTAHVARRIFRLTPPLLYSFFIRFHNGAPLRLGQSRDTCDRRLAQELAFRVLRVKIINRSDFRIGPE